MSCARGCPRESEHVHYKPGPGLPEEVHKPQCLRVLRDDESCTCGERRNAYPVPQTMPSESAPRKAIPLCSGVLDYFPAALAEVAKLSKMGNDKHNPGEPLHWTRGKSNDHADCIARHLIDRGIIDPDTGLSHTVEIAWRALALLQVELEERGAPKARGAD